MVQEPAPPPIPVQIYETTGGIFDTPTPPGQQTVAVGSGTLAFQSCTAATFSYTITGGSSSGLSGTVSPQFESLKVDQRGFIALRRPL